jgi:hypothetical protein
LLRIFSSQSSFSIQVRTTSWSAWWFSKIGSPFCFDGRRWNSWPSQASSFYNYHLYK